MSLPYILCMLALAKQGRGLTCGIMTFTFDDHYALTNATWIHDLCAFSVSWAKLEKRDKVRHNMTQTANLLAIATLFFIDSIEKLICETKKLISMQEFELNVQRAYA